MKAVFALFYYANSFTLAAITIDPAVCIINQQFCLRALEMGPLYQKYTTTISLKRDAFAPFVSTNACVLFCLSVSGNKCLCTLHVIMSLNNAFFRYQKLDRWPP